MSAEDLRLYDQAVIDLLFFKEQAIVDALLIEGLYKTVEKQDEIIVKSEKKLKLYRVVTIVCVSALTFTLLLRLLDD